MATVDFLKKIIQMTPVTRDCEHIPVITQSIPQIPDRTTAIFNKGPSPLPILIAMANTLKAAGADFGVMACNSAHHWYDDLIENSDLEMIHIVDAVCEELLRRDHSTKQVGLLATPGTIDSGFYQARLSKIGYDCLIPSEDQIKKVYTGIAYLKASDFNKGYQMLQPAIESFMRQKCSTIILGCTELPLVLDDSDIFLDSNKALAAACIKKAREIENYSQQS